MSGVYTTPLIFAGCFLFAISSEFVLLVLADDSLITAANTTSFLAAGSNGILATFVGWSLTVIFFAELVILAIPILISHVASNEKASKKSLFVNKLGRKQNNIQSFISGPKCFFCKLPNYPKPHLCLWQRKAEHLLPHKPARQWTGPCICLNSVEAKCLRSKSCLCL